MFGLCTLNGSHHLELKSGTPHLVVYNYKTGTIKSLFNISNEEMLSFVEKLGPFNYGPRLFSDDVLLRQFKKDLGLGFFYDGEWSADGLRHGIG